MDKHKQDSIMSFAHEESDTEKSYMTYPSLGKQVEEDPHSA